MGNKTYRNDTYGNSLVAYLKEISGITHLKKEEENILGKRILKGDQKSLNELVQRNLKYVVHVANAFKGCGLSLSDLIGEGNVGLIKAAHRFDPFRDIKFITYATWWVRQAIMHAVAEQSGAVRLPAKQASLLRKMNAKYKAFRAEHEREPTAEDLAKELDISPGEVESIRRAYRTHLSLNAPLKEEETTNYQDLLKSNDGESVEDSVFIDSLKDQIDGLLKKLSTREEIIIRLRFGFNRRGPLTLEEIGKEMHLSRERVRQIEKKATERLRSKTKIKVLKEFFT